MAELLQKDYEVYVNLGDISRVKLILSMRNMLAHGQYRPEVSAEFYKHRDDLGQGVEHCLRCGYRAIRQKPQRRAGIYRHADGICRGGVR